MFYADDVYIGSTDFHKAQQLTNYIIEEFSTLSLLVNMIKMKAMVSCLLLYRTGLKPVVYERRVNTDFTSWKEIQRSLITCPFFHKKLKKFFVKWDALIVKNNKRAT